MRSEKSDCYYESQMPTNYADVRIMPFLTRLRSRATVATSLPADAFNSLASFKITLRGGDFSPRSS